MNLLIVYFICWIVATAVAALLLLQIRTKYDFCGAYRRFLLKPWKVLTFLIAAAGITVAAPYSGDPTWDYTNSIIISVLVFSISPWTVGVSYRFIFMRAATWKDFYVAICLMLFAASWFYDAYIYLKSGVYPMSWSSNLVISPAIFITAGLLWNLSWTQNRGAEFAFRTKDWYFTDDDAASMKMIWYIIPFALPVAYMVYWFIKDFGN